MCYKSSQESPTFKAVVQPKKARNRKLASLSSSRELLLALE
jgi:hypothetical protein